VSPLHLLPLGSTPLEPDPETLWKDRLLIQVSNIVFIFFMIHNFLGTLIPVALELKLHV
jgi:cytochrome c biogenesis factor